METAVVPFMLQCGKPFNPATDAIGSIERWESTGKKLSSGKVLTSLEAFINAYIG